MDLKREEQYKKDVLEPCSAEHVDELVERGKAVIWPEKAVAWEKKVRGMIGVFADRGIEFDEESAKTVATALYVMECLSDGRSVDEMVRWLGSQPDLAPSVNLLIGKYHEKGPAVVREVSPEHDEWCDDMEKKNKEILEARGESSIDLASIRDHEEKAPEEIGE